MRHRKAGFKLQRSPSARRALLRGLATSVILQDRVITTVTKAKAVKPVVEKMITLGKRDTLHSRRQAASYLQTPGAVKRLFDTLAPRFSEREGGYTRIVRLGPRKAYKAVKPVVEKMITLGKRDTLHSRRQAASYLQTPGAVKRLFDTLAPRFSEREGGYTRIVRLGPRKGDGAEMALIEILGAELKKRAEDRRKRREERMKQQQEEKAATEDQASEENPPAAAS